MREAIDCVRPKRRYVFVIDSSAASFYLIKLSIYQLKSLLPGSGYLKR